MRRVGKIKIEWNGLFAYGIGLIATDGNLSPDNRHIHITSKDLELIVNFKNCFNLSNKIGKKGRGGSKEKKYFVVQFGDKNFYDFLLSIGLTQRKSKTIGRLLIPKDFFADFLRGCIDGDGCIGFYSHPESKHPQLRIRLCSASKDFLIWIKSEVENLTGIKSGWIEAKKDGMNVLVFAKRDSLKLIPFIYKENSVHLKRKHEVIERFYGRVAELV